MLELMILGRPLPWKAPYVGTRGAFSVRTPLMGDFKDILRKQLDDLYKKTDELNWHSDAVAVDAIFFMPIPKATSKKNKALMLSGEIRPSGRPDRGNLLKLIEDVLQGVVLNDDALVVDGRVAKYYDPVPRTVIRIYLADEYETLYGKMTHALDKI